MNQFSKTKNFKTNCEQAIYKNIRESVQLFRACQLSLLASTPISEGNIFTSYHILFKITRLAQLPWDSRRRYSWSRSAS